jgi:hypothetical protein
MCNLRMKVSLRWKFHMLMVILMVLMNNLSLKCTWKTCGNKIGLEATLLHSITWAFFKVNDN